MDFKNNTTLNGVFKFILKHKAYINEWEYQFVISLKQQFKKTSKLTPKQKKKLFAIKSQLKRRNINHKAIIYGQRRNP